MNTVSKAFRGIFTDTMTSKIKSNDNDPLLAVPAMSNAELPMEMLYESINSLLPNASAVRKVNMYNSIKNSILNQGTTSAESDLHCLRFMISCAILFNRKWFDNYRKCLIEALASQLITQLNALLEAQVVINTVENFSDKEVALPAGFDEIINNIVANGASEESIKKVAALDVVVSETDNLDTSSLSSMLEDFYGSVSFIAKSLNGSRTLMTNITKLNFDKLVGKARPFLVASFANACGVSEEGKEKTAADKAVTLKAMGYISSQLSAPIIEDLPKSICANVVRLLMQKEVALRYIGANSGSSIKVTDIDAVLFQAKEYNRVITEAIETIANILSEISNIEADEDVIEDLGKMSEGALALITSGDIDSVFDNSVADLLVSATTASESVTTGTLAQAAFSASTGISADRMVQWSSRQSEMVKGVTAEATCLISIENDFDGNINDICNAIKNNVVPELNNLLFVSDNFGGTFESLALAGGIEPKYAAKLKEYIEAMMPSVGEPLELTAAFKYIVTNIKDLLLL